MPVQTTLVSRISFVTSDLIAYKSFGTFISRSSVVLDRRKRVKCPAISSQGQHEAHLAGTTHKKRSRELLSKQDQTVSSSEFPGDYDYFGFASRGAAGLREDGAQEELREHEKMFRQQFLETIMLCSRNGNPQGAEDALKEMEVVGLQAGPRAHHGVIAAHTLVGDFDGAVRAFLRALGSESPLLYETFSVMVRLFGRLGMLEKGEGVLAVMERTRNNPRMAWLTLVEELWNSGAGEEANRLYAAGAGGGLRPADSITDLLVSGNCMALQHTRAVDILQLMMAHGRRPRTFHYNCLLSTMANAVALEHPEYHARSDPVAAESALSLLESMSSDVVEALKEEAEAHLPDVETYNLVLETVARKDPTRWEDCIMATVFTMVERKMMPNARTYELLVEGYSRLEYGGQDAMRFFRALRHTASIAGLNRDDLPQIDGYPYNPLVIFISHLAQIGYAEELLEVLETLIRNKVALPEAAMLPRERGRRTIVTSWLEHTEYEPDYGEPLDRVARYVDEGGPKGQHGDWQLHRGAKWPWFVRAEEAGFWMLPQQQSYRVHVQQEWRLQRQKLYHRLIVWGTAALDPKLNPTPQDVWHLMQRLAKDIRGQRMEARRPRPASKMLVVELRAELAGQGLPFDGRRPELYKRVQKARALNRARGRPLWFPPLEETYEAPEEHLDSLDASMSLERLYGSTPDGPISFAATEGPLWGIDASGDPAARTGCIVNFCRAAGITLEGHEHDESDEEDVLAEVDDDDAEDSVDGVDADFDEAGQEGEEEEVVAQGMLTASKMVSEMLPSGAGAPDQVVDVEEAETLAAERALRLLLPEDERAEFEASVKELQEVTIARVWGHHWEEAADVARQTPWSRDRELEVLWSMFEKVTELGGRPTRADCAMLLRRALDIQHIGRASDALRCSHQLGHTFGIRLYDMVLDVAVQQGGRRAVKSVLDDMKAAGVSCAAELFEKYMSAEIPVASSLQKTTRTK